MIFGPDLTCAFGPSEERPLTFGITLVSTTGFST
jgi:hypothetical protein